MGAFLLFAVLPLLVFVRRVQLRLVVGRLISRRICACCGYDLTGAAEETDGCSVCPECGAAWRIDVESRQAI